MPAVKALPSREDLVNLVIAAGSSHADFFGFPVREDGLYLQQDPEEYAAFVHYVASQVPPAALSLEIGIASGGQTKFLRDYWSSEKTIVLDIGVHQVFPHWKQIKQGLNSELILELIEDSHAPHVREKLLPYAGQIDFVFVDGDHSYRGLKKDIFLTVELLRDGGTMVLHDTAGVGDVNRIHQELLFSRNFTILRHFQNRFGISVWRKMRMKRRPNAFNRATGWGRI